MRSNNNIPVSCLQLLLIGLWLWLLSALIGTDCHYSVYVLCALTAAAWILAGRGHGPHSVRRQWLLWVFALLFAGGVLLANYRLYFALGGVKKLCYALGLLLGGLAAGGAILQGCAEAFPRMVRPRAENSRPVGVLLGAAAVMGLIYLAYLFSAVYPANMTPDSFLSIRQNQSGDYINNNPYWHTRMIGALMALGSVFSGDIHDQIALYSAVQALLLAGCFAYVAVTIYQAGLPVWCVALTVVFYALTPLHIAYSVTMWKDVLFSGSILVMLTALYRVLRGLGARPRLNYVMLAGGVLGFCLLRTNGWASCLISCLILLPALGRKHRKAAVLICVMLVVCWVLTGPVLELLEVGSTSLVEGLALPLQQMARLVAHGYEFAPEDQALLEKIFDMELIPEVFNHGTVDPIKGTAMNSANREYLRENLGTYIRLWLRLGLQHPTEYLKAWIELTKGYWNAGYEYWVYYEGAGNDALGVAQRQTRGWLGNVFRWFFDFVQAQPVFEPLRSIGLYVWMLFGCFALNLARGRREWMLAVPGMVIILGLWIGTPVFAEFRYAYPVVVAMPLLLAATLSEPCPRCSAP